MANRTLLFTTGSPFSRVVRVVLDELGLDYERHEEITTPSSEERAKYTPTLQVPTFWDNDVHLWESGVIIEYLLSRYEASSIQNPPIASSLTRNEFHWHDKLVAASIHSLGTSATTIGQMKWGGIAVVDSDYLKVCAERIFYLLNWLEEQIPEIGSGFQTELLSIQDISLVCHLDYILNRPIGIELLLSKYTRIEDLFNRLKKRPSFKSNPILWWEPGVIGYAEDGVTPIYST